MSYDYSLKLKKEKPKIVCVGRYVNQHTPTLHKCLSCNYEWSIKPMVLLQFSNPIGCIKCHLHNKYIQRLKLLKPSIICLGRFSHIDTKCLHKCKNCGNIWNAVPHSILRKGINGCPCCGLSNKKLRRTTTKILDGKIVELEGYENKAVDYLLQFCLEKEIICHPKNISFKYIDKKCQILRQHQPDILVGNTLYEVKSTYTFIINKESFYRNKLKFKAASAIGFNYEYLIFSDIGWHKTIPIKLPPFWLLFSYESMKLWMKGKRNARGY